MKFLNYLLIITLGLGVTFSAAAQETSTSLGSQKFPLEVHGFLLGTFSGRTTGKQSVKGTDSDFVLGEELLRLELSGTSETGEAMFLIKGDVSHDSLNGKTNSDLREAYAGYTRGPLIYAWAGKFSPGAWETCFLLMMSSQKTGNPFSPANQWNI